VSDSTTLDAFSALTWFVQSIALMSAFILPLLVHGTALYVVAAATVGTAYSVYHPIRRMTYTDIRLHIAHTFTQ